MFDEQLLQRQPYCRAVSSVGMKAVAVWAFRMRSADRDGAKDASAGPRPIAAEGQPAGRLLHPPLKDGVSGRPPASDFPLEAMEN
jgi:hypothetical protein